MAGSYYNGHLVDEDEADALAMAEPYGVEVVLAAEISGVDLVSEPPTVTLVSPSAGTPLRAGDAATFDVTSATPFHLESFVVRLVATGEREAAYDRTAPAGAWDPRYAGSSVDQLSATHYRILLRRATWPGGGVGILPRVSNAGGVAP